MYHSAEKEFKKIISEGIEAIPKKFLNKLENVVIIREKHPSSRQIKELKLRRGWTLFGLYEGIPQTNRGNNYGSVLPDKITIFQQPIEEEAVSKEELREIVKNTVWHEIAHHFGMDESQIRKAERRRKNNVKAKN